MPYTHGCYPSFVPLDGHGHSLFTLSCSSQNTDCYYHDSSYTCSLSRQGQKNAVFDKTPSKRGKGLMIGAFACETSRQTFTGFVVLNVFRTRKLMIFEANSHASYTLTRCSSHDSLQRSTAKCPTSMAREGWSDAASTQMAALAMGCIKTYYLYSEIGRAHV